MLFKDSREALAFWQRVRVVEYLVELPPVAVLRERLHRAIEHARERTALTAPEEGQA